MRPLELELQVPVPPTHGGADISDCGRYRYTLWRCWDDALPCLVTCACNPSTANAQDNDPTVRKLIGFAKRLGFGSILIVNLFAFRTTYPQALLAAHELGGDVFGPDNEEVIGTTMLRAKQRGWTFLVAWGRPKTKRLAELFEPRVRAIQLAALGLDLELKCLGTAKDGNPRHPLMLAYDTPLQPWRHPAMETPCSTT